MRGEAQKHAVINKPDALRAMNKRWEFLGPLAHPGKTRMKETPSIIQLIVLLRKRVSPVFIGLFAANYRRLLGKRRYKEPLGQAVIMWGRRGVVWTF